MKQHRIIFLFLGMVICLTCTARNGQAHDSVLQNPETASLAPIAHMWVDLDNTLCSENGFAPEDIAVWERYFEERFEYDEWEAEHIKYFVNEDRYLAIKDLQAIGFDEGNGSIPKVNCTLWRMMQYCARSGVRIPEGKGELARVMRVQIDSVLRYIPLSNADAGNRNALAEYLHGWFYDLLSYQIQSDAAPELRRLLEREDAAWKAYHEKALTSFTTISDSSGSGFHYQLYGFGARDQTLREIGVETFYAARFPEAGIPDDALVGNRADVSNARLRKAYRGFKGSLPDWGEGPFSTRKEMRSALNSERLGWNRWMKVRARISAKLTGDRKQSWDMATKEIRARKLGMLQRHYDIY